MIVPSIDLEGGSTVQLVGGEDKALDAGDPRPLLSRFGRVGETAVIDLDAATGEGSNEALVAELCRRGPVRVGGGIRDLATARRWLDRGAARIIIGTPASPDAIRGEVTRVLGEMLGPIQEPAAAPAEPAPSAEPSAEEAQAKAADSSEPELAS